MEERVMILQSDEEFKVNLLKAKLDDSGIPSWIINKHDSMYKTFGDLELYVLSKDVEQAKQIIDPSNA